MSRPALTTLFASFLALSSLAATGLFAASPPCTPCGGVAFDDPAEHLAALAAAPSIEEDERVYVAWRVSLQGDADTTLAKQVAATGATPWPIVRFQTAPPLLANVEALERELAVLADLARQSPPNVHVQIEWLPSGEEASAATAADVAFLIKRAAAAVNGAQPSARLIGPSGDGSDAFLEALYAEEIAAYIDGMAFQDPATIERAIETMVQLDPGRPITLGPLAAPTTDDLLIADAARYAALGVGVSLFEGGAGSIAPAKRLAREFKGDLSLDETTRPSGELEAWSFVRGEDLGLRIVVRPTTDSDELRLQFDDPYLKSPERIDRETGDAIPLYGVRRTETATLVNMADPAPVDILRIDRFSAEEIAGIEGLEESVVVTGDREIPVDEILRRLQAFEDDQYRRIQHYSATNTTHLRFQAGTGVNNVEATFRGSFFREQGGNFDWAWEEFLVNGVRWRGKRIPEIPLVEPEKAAALPLLIAFTKQYRYTLRGTDTLDEREVWVIDFEPVEIVEGETLYQGTVWVDRKTDSRLKTRAVQLGLQGEVLSNEETIMYRPFDANGNELDLEADGYWLPSRIVSQQLLSILNSTTVVERETVLTNIEINSASFETRRQAILDTDVTMVRDTDQGMRYLIKDEETGERVVQEEFDKNRLFGLGGVFADDSVDFPIPLAGVNFLSFDWRGTGAQANVFFAGVLTNISIADPSFLGSRWDFGADLFLLGVEGTDTIFRGDEESPLEDVGSLSGNIDIKLGHPVGNFGKIDFEYELQYTKFGTADDTAEEFVIPADHFTHSLSLAAKYNRAGYSLRANGTFSKRSDWDPWGLPVPGVELAFDPETEDYVRWGVSASKTFHLPKFQKFGLELEYIDGERLDRFSKYGFGFFSDVTVHGYQSDRVRAEKAAALHLSYGFEVGELFRLQLVGDVASATDEESGLDNETLAGVGIVGTFLGPWETIVNVDVGTPVAGPDDGWVVFLAFLKLFK